MASTLKTSAEPSSVDVHIVILDPTDEEIRQAAMLVSRELKAHGLRARVDDRRDAPERDKVETIDSLGNSLGDSLGCPVQIRIGSLGLLSGEVELKLKHDDLIKRVKLEDVVEKTVELVRELKRN